MIVALLNLLRNWLERVDLYRFVRVFDWLEFRALAAVIVSFLFVVIFGKRVIRWLVRQKLGDAPEFYHSDLNRLMAQKANTPTMGGILIAGSILFTTLLLADLNVYYINLGLVLLALMTILGGIDDWLKLTNARRGHGSREGLHAWEKLLFQLGFAFLAGLFIYRYGHNNTDMAHTLPSIPTIAIKPVLPGAEAIWQSPQWLFIALATIMIAGSSNAVNLTDGMDGLASGIAVICSFALMFLCGIIGTEKFASFLLMPYIPYTAELAVIAGAMGGACLGFMWFNCSPAQVFMGDTGSLAIGALGAYIAVVIRQEFLALIIGGVYLLEMMSVVLQVGYFKMTGGRRIFRCAPIHHHFHLGGWTEQQVVVRFWIITLILTAIALATIKLR